MKELDDADRAAVVAMFKLLDQVAAALFPELQIIVLDHARIAEKWFANATTADWHSGDGLIPSSWIG